MSILKHLANKLLLSNEKEKDFESKQQRDGLFAGPNTLKQLLVQEANSRSGGYGHHSGYGGDHHSGYGDAHSGYDHHSGYGHDDGYASHSGYGHEPCCPPVIDPLTLIALLGIRFLFYNINIQTKQ